MSIDFLAAKSKADEYLRMLEAQPDGVRYAILETMIKEDGGGWHFPYQSAAFVEIGDFNKSLVGNWPIFVSRSGRYVGPRRPGVPIPGDADETV